MGDGSQWGIQLKDEVRPVTRAIAEAFLLGRHFIESADGVLILGDRISSDADLQPQLQPANVRIDDATGLARPVADPQPSSASEMDENGRPISMEEKPLHTLEIPLRDFFYSNYVLSLTSKSISAALGELGIIDNNRLYMEQGGL